MEYRKLGKSGLQVSALSFGSWITFGNQIKDSTAEDLMVIAYDAGINFFDNAEGYANGQSEIVMGKILKNRKWDRSSYLISSKVFYGDGGKKPNQQGLSRKHIIEGCNASLKRLQLEYLDLFFCHSTDPHTSVEESVWAMNSLLQQGKILYWGTSGWSFPDLMEAYQIAEKNCLVPPTVEQPQYNMFERNKLEKEYLYLFSHYGLGTTIYSPLASGLLTGKYSYGPRKDTRIEMEGLEWLKTRVLMENKINKVKQLSSLAKDMGTTVTLLSLAWCLKNPNVSTVILGASKTEQLKENLEAFTIVEKISRAVIDQIELILNNKPT